MNYLKKRKLIKTSRELIRHAHLVRNMREDIMPEKELKELSDSESRLRAAVETGNASAIVLSIERLTKIINKISPYVKGGWLRENFEILVVALAVAMSLRAYFLQPFKIPTGSMQPTLYGITSVQKDKPDLMDKYPLKLLKYVATGKWYSERYAKSSGTMSRPSYSSKAPSVVVFEIGGKNYKIPRDAISKNRYELKFKPGDIVNKGELLWSGIVTRGDHIFVNKIIWNFRKPHRGEIMVFTTTGIKGIQQGTHYIKRMCGLPNENVSINPPNLVINNKIVNEPDGIKRVTSNPNYQGYKNAGHLSSPNCSWSLKDDQYFAMGDNTGNSLDSRYWGSVPKRNLVGPAVIIYWPFSKRWGLAK